MTIKITTHRPINACSQCAIRQDSHFFVFCENFILLTGHLLFCDALITFRCLCLISSCMATLAI